MNPIALFKISFTTTVWISKSSPFHYNGIRFCVYNWFSDRYQFCNRSNIRQTIDSFVYLSVYLKGVGYTILWEGNIVHVYEFCGILDQYVWSVRWWYSNMMNEWQIIGSERYKWIFWMYMIKQTLIIKKALFLCRTASLASTAVSYKCLDKSHEATAYESKDSRKLNRFNRISIWLLQDSAPTHSHLVQGENRQEDID